MHKHINLDQNEVAASLERSTPRSSEKDGRSETLLTLEQAARFLRMNPESLRRKAKAGEVPGAKIGRSWLFYEPDLVANLRSLYPASRALQGKEENPCSANSRAVRIGTFASRRQMDAAYAELLGLPIESSPKSTKSS
jgi:hypothetical protein